MSTAVRTKRRPARAKCVTAPDVTRVDGVELRLGDATDFYAAWPKPTAIVVDGPYGVAGFPGDPPTPEGLPEWYAPHVAAWTQRALPETTLWFWGTELGWALVHPVMDLHGWEYRTCHVWNKGMAHVAGNVNGTTIRKFPVVTEVCVQYVRKVTLPTETGELLPLREWLRHEWERSGLPLYRSNDACGVANAATRKYLTLDHMWYFPPADMIERLVAYANEHGAPTKRPYFSIDGKRSVTGKQWSKLRAKWNHIHGLTNCWDEPAVRGAERLKDRHKPLHTNQKPLSILRNIITASTDPGDVVWDPFSGTFSTGVAAAELGRRCVGAEINPDFFELASNRLRGTHGNANE